MVSQFFKNYKYALVISIVIFIHTGCTKTIDPYRLTVSSEDQVVTQYPPENDEIQFQRKFTLSVIIDRNNDLNDQQRSQFAQLIHNLFENNVLVTILDTKKIVEKEGLSYPALIHQPANFIAVHARKFNVDYASIIHIKNVAKQKSELHIQFEFNYFDVNSSNYLLKDIFTLDLHNNEQFVDSFTEYLQIHLPLKAFIIEMRGVKKVARISLGKNAKIEKGRKVLLKKRVVEKNIFGEGTETIFVQKNIKYKENPISRAKVISVEDESSWILLNNDAKEFFVGDPVFLIPE